jgi:hypothetical protein
MQLTFIPALAAPLMLTFTNTVLVEGQVLPNRDACWKRIYDDAHLKAHPIQQVVKIRLLHLLSRWPQSAQGVTFIELEMNLRTRTPGAMRSTTDSAGSASRALVDCAVRQNGVPAAGRSNPERMNH